LSGDNWKNKTDLPTNSDIYGGVNDTGNDINNKNIYNLTLNTTANNLTVDTVGIQEEPEAPTQSASARVNGGGDGGDGGGGTIATPSLTGTIEDLPTSSTPTQNITFSPTGSTIPGGETVTIDLSNANGPVDYDNIGNGITTNFSGNLNTVNDGSTFAIEFTPSTNIATSRTIGVQIRSVPTQDTVTTGLPVYVSRSDGDGFNTTFSLFDGGSSGGGGGDFEFTSTSASRSSGNSDADYSFTVSAGSADISSVTVELIENPPGPGGEQTTDSDDYTNPAPDEFSGSGSLNVEYSGGSGNPRVRFIAQDADGNTISEEIDL
jgi:hypothetical protein